jgi:hypothetical protein
MAETVGTLDIKRLLADAAKTAATNKAARVAAKAAADRANARNAAEKRVKLAAQSASSRAEGLERQIKADLQVIKNITQGITDYSDGVPNPVALRELKSYVARYNESIAEQQRLLKESQDLSAGKFDVNEQGKLVAKPVQPALSGADAARERAMADRAGMGGYPSSALGGTPSSVVADATADEAKAGVLPKVTPTPTPTPKVPKTPEQVAADKVKADKAAADKAKAGGKLTAEQEARLGTFGSKFLIEYFKTAENGKYKPIYDKLVTFAIQNAQPAKVEAYLRDTAWYKDVNERTYAVIGASALANGIKLDTATRDSYRDQILGKVKTAEEIAYDIRMKSIGEYQLQTTKPEVARQMMAGKDFATAVGDYINTYTTNFELAASQFSLEDANFQALFKSSTSLGDFDKKLKRSDKYLSLPKVQTAISQNITMVKQKYRQYGLNLTDEAASNLGKNAYLGDTTTEAIDENLRQQAIKLFPAFKDRILNGESVLSIASPYIGAVSRILEVPEGSLDLEDPTIRKAMMGTTTTTGDKTATTVKPLWEFEQELFKDSRWQYTSNARQRLDGITLDVMGRFGVIG